MIPIPLSAWVAVGLCTAFVAVAGVQTYRLQSEQLDHVSTKGKHAQAVADAEARGREAEKAERVEEQRRIKVLEEVVDEARKKETAARADAARLGDAGQRLRQQLGTALAAVCTGTSGDATAAVGGPPRDKTLDLLADMQRRLDGAADAIAGFADEAHRRGEACEQSYNKVRSP